jgi:hypothetical protein
VDQKRNRELGAITWPASVSMIAPHFQFPAGDAVLRVA